MLKNKYLNAHSIKEILGRVKNHPDFKNISVFPFPNKGPDFDLPFCVQIQTQLGGELYSSWGTADNIDEASVKAFAELIERISLDHYFPIQYKNKKLIPSKHYYLWELEKKYHGAKSWFNSSSSGLAVHTDKNKAQASALSELIERHVILKCLAYKLPPKKSIPPAILKHYKIPKEVSLNFYYWNGPLDHKVSICEAKVGKGAFYSFGCSQDLSTSLIKSFLEAVGPIIYSVSTDHFDFSFNDQLLQMNYFRRYHRYSNDQSAQFFLKSASHNEVTIDSSLKSEDFYYAEIDFPSFFGNIQPLVGVRSVSPKTQSIFYENWNESVLNPLAIPIKQEQLPKWPHFIG